MNQQMGALYLEKDESRNLSPKMAESGSVGPVYINVAHTHKHMHLKIRKAVDSTFLCRDAFISGPSMWTPTRQSVFHNCMALGSHPLLTPSGPDGHVWRCHLSSALPTLSPRLIPCTTGPEHGATWYPVHCCLLTLSGGLRLPLTPRLCLL